MMTCFLATLFVLVQLNCENLFDCTHDIGKNDTEFTPDGSYRWTRTRYWRKLNRTAQTLLSCARTEEQLIPDMAVLCEVENDTVMRDLTQRSLLRGAHYRYVMTDSPDERGIDVALVYSPMSFRLLTHHSVRVTPVKGMRPTRDLLYAKGIATGGDTLHVVGVHFPSKRGGEGHSRPFRLQAARRLCQTVDSITAASPGARIVVAGDFNMYAGEEAMELLAAHGLTDVSARAAGQHGAKGTYRYHGRWGSLDHVLVSAPLLREWEECYVNDAPFLTAPDEKYGGVQPRRNYLGPAYKNGFSDHLPLVATFSFK